MFAVIGIKGSSHHDYRYFPHRRTREIMEWARARRDEILNANPAQGSLPITLLSDKAAYQEEWADGDKVYYRRSDSWQWEPITD